jgi:hypothetical protein
VEENAFGPDQLYVAPPIVVAVKLRSVPAQTGELLEAVGAPGEGFTVTETIPAGLLHPLSVATTE